MITTVGVESRSGWGYLERKSSDMDELSRKRFFIGALAAIENLKAILALRGNWAFDIRIRLLEMEKELEVADCKDPGTDKLLKTFSLLHQEILEGR